MRKLTSKKTVKVAIERGGVDIKLTVNAVVDTLTDTLRCWDAEDVTGEPFEVDEDELSDEEVMEIIETINDLGTTTFSKPTHDDDRFWEVCPDGRWRHIPHWG